MAILVGVLIGIPIGSVCALLNVLAEAETMMYIRIPGTPQTFREVLREHGLTLFVFWVVLSVAVGGMIGWAASTTA